MTTREPTVSFDDYENDNQNYIEVTDRLIVAYNSKMVLSFEPYDSRDKDVIIQKYLSNPDSNTLSAYLVRLRPIITLGGERHSTENISINPGGEMILNSRINAPSKGTLTDSIFQKNITSGCVYSFTPASTINKQNRLVNSQKELNEILEQVTAQRYEQIHTEDFQGNIFNAIINTYFARTDNLINRSPLIFKVYHTRMPSLGFCHNDVTRNNLFGILLSIKSAGLAVDVVTRNITLSYDGNKTDEDNFTYLTGFSDSFFEGQVFSDFFPELGNGVTTISAFYQAAANNYEFIIFTSDNVNMLSAYPEIDANLGEEIRDDVNSGLQVIIHSKLLAIDEWSGFGYIVFNPITLSAAYRISEGYNGSKFKKLLDRITCSLYPEESYEKEQCLLLMGIVSIVLALILSVSLLSKDISSWVKTAGIITEMIVLLSAVFKILDDKTMSQTQKATEVSVAVTAFVTTSYIIGGVKGAIVSAFASLIMVFGEYLNATAVQDESRKLPWNNGE